MSRVPNNLVQETAARHMDWMRDHPVTEPERLGIGREILKRNKRLAEQRGQADGACEPNRLRNRQPDSMTRRH